MIAGSGASQCTGHDRLRDDRDETRPVTAGSPRYRAAWQSFDTDCERALLAELEQRTGASPKLRSASAGQSPTRRRSGLMRFDPQPL